MKKIKVFLAITPIATFGFLSANAQGCHGGGGMGNMNHSSMTASSSDYASHGGIVKQSGKYLVEMVVNPMLKEDPVTFYLMNKKGKPINNAGIVGKAEFTFKEASPENLSLETRGENAFAAQLVAKTQSFTCRVVFQVDGENITAQFENSGFGGPKSGTVYTCSMHPEITANKPGNCPKCGMELIRKTNE